MENLNAEQVKKALECCTNVGKGGLIECACGDCPYDIGKDDCKRLDEYALALINSQEQRIKELTEENNGLQELVRVAIDTQNSMGERIEKLTEQNESIRRRMHHLFQSKFIASFDEVDRKTKEYKRNIAEADILIGVKEQYEIENIALSAEIEWLTNENKRLNKLLDDKCDRCIERERADTVRKMQERLKERKVCYGNITFKVVPIDDIDQIAKEMIGDAE